MAEEREGPTRGDEKRKREEEKRKEADRRRKRGRDREKPTAAVAIVKKADELLEGVKESELPEPEKKSFEEKLGDVKEKAGTRERKKDPVEELMQVMELFLELGKIEDEIADTKKQEIWKKLQQKTRGIQKAVREGKLTKKDVDIKVGQLLNEIRDKEEEISDEELQSLIGQVIGKIEEGRIIDEGELEEIIEDAEKTAGREFSEKEKEAVALENLLGRRGRLYTEDEERILEKKDAEAEELIDSKFNLIYESIDSSPDQPWQEAMTIEDSITIAKLKRDLLKRGTWGRQILTRINKENELRRHIYTAFYGIGKGAVPPGKAAEVFATFGSELRNVLFEVPGAAVAARIYEAGVERLLSHDDYVQYGKVVYKSREESCELDDWARARFEEYLKRQYRSGEEFRKEWPAWKISRALSLGKGHGLLTIRLAETTAKGRIPEGVGSELLSPWLEDYIRVLDPLQWLYQRFGQGGPGLAILHYMVTGKEMDRTFTLEEYRQSLETALEKDPEKKRLIDELNLLGIGGPWTQSAWRAMMAMDNVPGETAEELMHFGLNPALIAITNRIEKKMKGKSKKEIEDAQKPEVREAWKLAFDRDIMQFIREAEISDEALEGLLKKIIPDKKDEKRRENILGILKEFRVDQRMKHLVLLDFLRRTEGENWHQEWEKYEYSPKMSSYKKNEILERRGQFLDEIENKYLWLREIAVEAGAQAGKFRKIDTSLITDTALRKKVETYIQSVKKITELKFGPEDKDTMLKFGPEDKDTILENLVERTVKDEFRMGLGNADVAWTLFDFSGEGHVGFQRRLRDLATEAAAVGKLGEILGHFGEYQKEPMAFVKEVKELFDTISGYDRKRAVTIAEKLCEGFIRASDGDWMVKFLPFPLDRLANMLFRNSYAEKVLGEGALSLTAIDKRNLIKHFRELGMFGTKDDPTGHHKEEKLFRRLGAQRWRVGIEFLIKYGPFGILFIFYQIWKEYEEKTSQAFK